MTSIVGNGGRGIGARGVKTITTNYILTQSDLYKILLINSATPITITISADIYAIKGAIIAFVTEFGSPEPNFTPASGVTLDAQEALINMAVTKKGMMSFLINDGYNNWISANTVSFMGGNAPLFFNPLSTYDSTSIASPWACAKSSVAVQYYLNKNSVLIPEEANKPMIAWDPILRRHFLIVRWASLSNLFADCMDTTQATWTKTNTTPQNNTTALLGNNLLFDTIECDSATGDIAHTLSISYTGSGFSRASTKTIIAAKGGLTHIGFLFGEATSTVKGLINLTTGTVETFSSLTGSGISNIQSNRIIVKRIKAASGSNPAVYSIEIARDTTGTGSITQTLTLYMHNGTTHLFERQSGLGFYILGANLTSGAAIGDVFMASTTTVVGSAITHTSNAIYGGIEGTVYLEFSSDQLMRGFGNSSRRLISVHDAANLTADFLTARLTSASSPVGEKVNNRLSLASAVIGSIDDTINIGPNTIHKLAFTYSLKGLTLAVNGRIVGTVNWSLTAANLADFATIDTLQLGGSDSGTGLFHLNVYGVGHISERVSNSELQAMTAVAV